MGVQPCISDGLQLMSIRTYIHHLCISVYDVEWASSSYRPKNGGQYCTGPELQCLLCNTRVSVLVAMTFILYINTSTIRSIMHLHRHACCNTGCLFLCTLPLDSTSWESLNHYVSLSCWLQQCALLWVCVELTHNLHTAGPEELVRLLRFWPDQYFKLQQYIFN